MTTTDKDLGKEKVFISSLSEKQSISTTFLAKNKILLKDKKGKSYISCQLSDSSGDIDAKAWDNIELLEGTFQSGDIVWVKGVVQVYQNRKQLVMHKVERFDGTVNVQDYLKKSDVDPEEMLQKLIQVVETIQSGYVKQLITDTITDPTIKPLLLVAPAAKSVHHAKMGGLLEHILSIVNLCDSVVKNYPVLNRDLLIFGAIFHDIGKIWELKIDDGGIHYTDKGRMIGHLVMAVELIEKKASKIFNFPEQLKDICKHMILAHHGKFEYGSPKLPQTLEAYMVWMLDDLDSKMDSIQQAMRLPSGDENWSAFSPMFDRYFYLKGTEWPE